MDSFDHQILALLRHQARLPVSRIAESVNLSRPAVSERIARLEKAGVIRGYHARIAPPQDGAVKAFLQIVHDHHLCQRYADLLAALKRILKNEK